MIIEELNSKLLDDEYKKREEKLQKNLSKLVKKERMTLAGRRQLSRKL